MFGICGIVYGLLYWCCCDWGRIVVDVVCCIVLRCVEYFFFYIIVLSCYGMNLLLFRLLSLFLEWLLDVVVSISLNSVWLVCVMLRWLLMMLL